MKPTTERFTPEQIKALAKSAVEKVDQLGPRGTTLCTMDEIEAMACLIVASGALIEADPVDGSLPDAKEPTDDLDA